MAPTAINIIPAIILKVKLSRKITAAKTIVKTKNSLSMESTLETSPILKA